MSNRTFTSAFYEVLRVEGGYVHHPSDPGGATRYGITEQVARRHGYDGDMRDLPTALAQRIYRDEYWDELRLDKVEAIAGPEVAVQLFEAGVNVGTRRVAQWLQRCLRAFNQRGSTYRDIDVDGIVGPETLKALRSFINFRRIKTGASTLRKGINGLQAAHYITLAERDERFEDFVFGWIAHRIDG